MNLRTLLCLTLFALTAHSQTKEAQFRKIEALIKKSNGLSKPGLSISSQVFTEKSAKMEGTAEGEKQTVSYTGLNWDGFDYRVTETDTYADISLVKIHFDKAIDVTYSINDKPSKERTDEMVLFIATADEELAKQYLEELKAYTWKMLNGLRTASREELISFLTKKLNAAVKWDDAKVKSMDDCEITFAYADGVETTLPIQKLELHENKNEYYVFCYGESKANVQVKTKSSSATSKYVEHPIVELDFDEEEAEDLVQQIQYAIERLAGFCRL